MNKWFYHSGSAGDMLYALPTIIASGGGSLCTTPQFCRTVDGILKKQPCLKSIRYYLCYARFKMDDFGKEIYIEGEGPFINLDTFRNEENASYVKGNQKHIARACLDAIGVDFDLTKQWLFNIEGKTVAPIIINYTDKYHSGDQKKKLDWYILKKYRDLVMFVGPSKGYWQLVDKMGFEPKFYLVNKKNIALSIAEIIKGSKLFIGNQSLGFAIAEGLKHPRCLDIWPERANCVPYGDNGYTTLNEEIIERYINGSDR